MSTHHHHEHKKHLRTEEAEFRDEFGGGAPPAPTPPAKATGPTPADGATDVDSSAVQWIHWANSGNTDWTLAVIYFGTDPASLQPSWTTALNPIDQWNYGGGAIVPGTTYYWRLDLTNANGTTTGDVWSFSTAA